MDFKANNSLDIGSLYRERKKYKEKAYPANLPRPRDFLYESTKYGTRNDENETICLLVDETTRATLRQFPESDQEGAIFFVNAFVDFRNDFLSQLARSRLPPLPGIRDLKVKKGFVPFGEKYSLYLASMKDFVKNKILPEHKIYNFQDFISVMRKFVFNYSRDFPITRSGFIDSRNCPMHVNGLMADLSEEDASRDDRKKAFFDSPTFKCYLNTAHEYGLIVDKNVPWRLVADIESKNMRKYILRYGSEKMSNRQILDFKFFTKPHFDDYYDLQDLLFSIYKDLVLEKPFEVTYNKKKRDFTERESLPYWFDEEKYDSKFWLELLLDVKINESDLEADETRRNGFLTEILDTEKVYGLKSAIGHLGMIIAKNRKKQKQRNSFKPTKLKEYL